MNADAPHFDLARALIRRHGCQAARRARDAERRTLRLGRRNAARHWGRVEVAILSLRVAWRLERGAEEGG